MPEDTAIATSDLRALSEPASALAARRNESVYLVGGTVRDALRGGTEAVADVDLALAGDAPAFGRELADAIGGAYVPLAEERGTVRVVAPDRTCFDITAFGGSIEADLRRRDFTINALAFGPLQGEPALIDPTGGRADLSAGVVRAVSARALADDPLRALRAFRFAAALGFAIEPATLTLVRDRAPATASAAPERIARELFLLLAAPRAAGCVRVADAVGVLPAVLPETLPMRGVTQNEYHHLDVWAHSLETVATLERVLADLPAIAGAHTGRVEVFLGEEPVEGRPRVALLKLAALLHDVGKPPARAEDEGRVTFYTHARLGARIASETAERLRLSSRETAELAAYVDRHMVPADLEASRPLSDKRLFRFFRRNGEAGVALLLLAVADGMATRGPASDPVRTGRLVAFAAGLIAEYYERVGPRLDTPPVITGRDLIAEFDLPPGPLLGRLLDEVRERQLASELVSRDAALAHVRRVLERGHVR